jgi:hypothetical protein
VKSILAKGLDAEELATPPTAPLSDAYTGKGRFSRKARQLLLWDPGTDPHLSSKG